MQKIFFIGKFNEFYREVHEYLSKHFEIQMCVDNPEVIRGMLNLYHPDLILVSTIDMEESARDVFYELEKEYVEAKILCLEHIDQLEKVSDISGTDSFASFELPASVEKIYEKICSLMCEVQEETEAEGPGEEEPEEEKPCVMFIDDNAFQIRVLKEMLKNKYDVLLATSGIEALEIIAKRVPDIVFLDYDMPEYDGRQTLEFIRMVSGAEQVPVFFLTGVKDEAQKEAAMELNPTGYLLKPATAEMIHACLDKYLK